MSDRRLGEILGHKAATISKVLAALRAEGVVRETLEEGRITDPDALFLFSRLTELQQESLRRAAARADVTISRGMVRKRLEEIDERRRAEAEPAPHPAPQGEAPRDEPSVGLSPPRRALLPARPFRFCAPRPAGAPFGSAALACPLPPPRASSLRRPRGGSRHSLRVPPGPRPGGTHLRTFDILGLDGRSSRF